LKIGIILIALAMLPGCAAKNTFQMYETLGKENYPAVSLIVNDGYVYSDTTCHQYGCTTYVDNTSLFALKALRKNDLFERVDINNAHAEYKILMKFSRQNSDSDGMAFAKLMLSAVTLFLFPVSHEYTYKSEFTIVHMDKVIGKYTYDRKSEEVSFLFKEPQSNKQNAVDSIISNLMHDVKENQTFKNSTLQISSENTL